MMVDNDGLPRMGQGHLLLLSLCCCERQAFIQIISRLVTIQDFVCNRWLR